MERGFIKTIFILFCLLYSACNMVNRPNIALTQPSTVSASIFPNYADSLILPPNIAPLNFRINTDSLSHGPYFLRLYAYDATGNKIDSLLFKTNCFVQFNIRDWKRCLHSTVKGKGFLKLEIFARNKQQWIKYAPKIWQIATDSIDPYIVYRLNAHDDNPGLRLQVVQRSLSDFSQTVLMDNRLTEDNCMNCHVSSNNNAHKMMVHIRGKYFGTLLFDNNNVFKIVLPEGYPDLRLAYPSWSADGRFIAFASTRIQAHSYANSFRTQDLLADTLGKILVYDIESNRLFSSPELMEAHCESTFPAWSPDGKTLYFCRATSWDSLDSITDTKARLASFLYRLVSVSFNPKTGTFGEIKDVFDLKKHLRSISMPSLNPDGNYILATSLLFGSYPSQNQGDLILLKRNTQSSDTSWNEVDASALNSLDSERYHTWSSNGRWVVFDSKRINGGTALIHIAYFDRNGQFSQPFVLPQKSGDFYLKNTRSFIFPTLNRNSATFTVNEWAEAVKKAPIHLPDMTYFEKYQRVGQGIRSGH